MSVFKRGGSKHYYVQFNFRGKTYIKSTKTSNKRIAERMEHEWKEQVHREVELGELQRIKLKDALIGYCEDKKNTGCKEYAKSNARLLTDKFDVELYVDEIRDWHLVRFKSLREAEGLSPLTIKHNFQGIRSTVQWAKDHGYKTSHLTYPKMKMPKHRLRYLSLDEEKRFLQELDPTRDIPFRQPYAARPKLENQKRQDMYDLVVLLLDTGARYGEIANILWSRIDLENRTINLWRPKVRNESIIYMTSRVHAILTRRSADRQGEHVFCNEKGEARGYAAKGIRLCIKNAGLEDFKIHDLRHTAASRLIQNGMSLYEVAQILGHTDVQTTQRYAHLAQVDVSKRARDIMESIGG